MSDWDGTENRKPGKRMQFIPVIRLGDLITVGSVLIAGTAAWTKMDARIAMVEDKSTRAEARAERIQYDVKDELREQRNSILRVEDKIERLRK
jgi:hypothetical protein